MHVENNRAGKTTSRGAEKPLRDDGFSPRPVVFPALLFGPSCSSPGFSLLPSNRIRLTDGFIGDGRAVSELMELSRDVRCHVGHVNATSTPQRWDWFVCRRLPFDLGLHAVGIVIDHDSVESFADNERLIWSRYVRRNCWALVDHATWFGNKSAFVLLSELERNIDSYRRSACWKSLFQHWNGSNVTKISLAIMAWKVLRFDLLELNLAGSINCYYFVNIPVSQRVDHFYFYDDFGNSGPIFIIFSLLNS